MQVQRQDKERTGFGWRPTHCRRSAYVVLVSVTNKIMSGTYRWSMSGSDKWKWTWTGWWSVEHPLHLNTALAFCFSCSSLTTTRWTGVLQWPATEFSWLLSSCWSVPSILSARTWRWASKSIPHPYSVELRKSTTSNTKPWWPWSCCCQCWCSSACT